MAGLLDSFFGNSFEDPKSQAVMALAGGLLSNDWKKGVNGYMQSMAGAGEYETNKKLQQAKMQEMMMKAAAEKQKMDQERAKNEMFMNMFSPSGQSSGQSAQGGLLGDTQGGDPFAGVDKRALMLDYLQNGGKNMGGWVHDRTKPDMQVTSGYAYDKNRLGAGFMPSLTTSTDGKTSMIRIGADGLPVVTAPQGAVETFGAYQGKQADFKPIQVYNPETGRTELQTEGNVIKAAQAPKAMPQRYNGVSGYAGGSVDKGNAGALEIMQSELAKPNISQQDREAIGREIQRIKAQSPQLAQSGAFAAAPSQMEIAQAKATEAALVDTAKANVVRDTGRQGEQKRQGQLGAGVDRAIELLNQNPTASGGGALIDSAANFFGSSTKGADTASKLDTLSGWLVSNVPRMEGPQSDKDVLSYKTMAAEVGDRTKPISQRLAAAQELKALQAKYADLNGGGQTKEPKPSKVIDALPPANIGNKGQRIRDTTTGKILKSNGISWVAE